MSNHENPCAGYLLPARDLKSFLPHELQEQFENAVDDCDWETTGNLLRNNWPETFPQLGDVFLLGDEDTGDGEMEQGEIYVQFDQDELFILTPTIGLEALKHAGGKEPQHHQWTIYG